MTSSICGSAELPQSGSQVLLEPGLRLIRSTVLSR